ncbi:lyase family protein [Pseudooceanicola aestuarii]|uniref:lyase family protein n=1 Tax=Pseudooceanicola aestuarii TaxID=2697319 RepID=UPI0013D50AC4|nr:lyase family protein [Pseudooceanicola aestuarii]
MAGSVHDSTIYHRLFPAGEAGRLFTDTAEVRAMLLVEGALAKAQGAMGLIPEISAQAIHRATLEIPPDPGALGAAAGQNGVPVPGLVAEFRKAMQAPEHAQYLHWGATSQDIMDSALMLRLRQLLIQCETGLRAVLTPLADLAAAQADQPMAGRTYGQDATPTSLGAHVAQWGWPLLELLAELPALRAGALWVSLSGAAGTGAEFAGRGAELRAALAVALNLQDPGRSWHVDRGPVLRIAAWLTRVATALGKIGEDLTLAVQSSQGELRLGQAGGSSTMPQKQNPVQPSVLIALARQAGGLNATLSQVALSRQERDGAAWFTEWLTLPQLCLGTAAAVETARAMVPGIAPVPQALAAGLARSGGLIHAEALSFRLARDMRRPEAQQAVKDLARHSAETGHPLSGLAQRAFPEAELSEIFDPARQMGEAPANARAFASAVRDLPRSHG